ncbi:hypothetical protein [Bradyrhizobium liaoningense]
MLKPKMCSVSISAWADGRFCAGFEAAWLSGSRGVPYVRPGLSSAKAKAQLAS